jgi:hypothetical protein
MGHANYYAVANHETASQFIGQRNLRLDIRQAIRPKLSGPITAMDFPPPIRFNGGQTGQVARDKDEEAGICNSPDRIARLGANEIVTQGRDRAGR